MSMTLEQAIRILHPDTSLDTLNTVLVACNYSSERVLEAENEALLLACEVMQREVERGKGCEWCSSLKKDMCDFKPGDLLARGMVEYTIWGDEAMKQKRPLFCAMCGKPLNDGKVDGDE